MTLSDHDLRRRLAGQQWTSHNIRLSDAITTMPGQPDFLETDLRLKAILRAVSFLYRDSVSDLRVADLGCLEGGFALALAERGMRVTGIEARRKNFEKVKLLKEHFGFENLNFELDDVKNFNRERYGIFDVTLALGILYHLDSPVAWLRQISRATRGLLIIESHYAPSDEASLALIDERLKLGPLKIIKDGEDVYEGRWFFEYDSAANREDQLWASYSNHQSFWLTKESLLKATVRAGFDLVLEQHDYSVDSYKFLTTTFSRAMFLAIKSDGFKSR
ncbi:MAG TPA: methyltransferase domain-containing protein [Pyrinomonadaceae bacterium]|nr:methyltransferase domain-containing protein [Pyrinomonadaceae bacterium]